VNDIDPRIAQMMRVMEVLHDKGLSFTDSMDVLRAFYELPGRHRDVESTEPVKTARARKAR
jgi:hypothetical protein